MLTKARSWVFFLLFGCVLAVLGMSSSSDVLAQDSAHEAATHDVSPVGGAGQVADIGSHSILSQAWRSGLVVFTVLIILVIGSIMSWAILFWKMLVLRKHSRSSDVFIKSFWDSRSLNDLNSRLGEYPYSPAKEVFRTGYSELVRGSQLKDSSPSAQMAINAAMENINRSLTKAKRIERKKLETFLPLLATIASAAPFIGLFGTVWGIMGSFEGIARTGSASLAAVAPGISEALIATAFGLAAAIPAVIAFNASNARIRSLTGSLDGFSMDFMNIVGRYLVSDRKSSAAASATTQAPI
jgi:biopolymer transport protein TolQ